ncbi:30S ribosomal protein S21 [candidate division WWE3 bacterium CG09_land_8_20_14_0_10_39_24]|uniref:Small ribosomal subunit protein bS21 n=2 Tax=Katanobacteria TaxID=422282 RepID=A0A2G9XCS4_UNCKA|nr:MAG: 30S ribosomal protein S21 [candidate division WWE3 bacterium CG23_combo_of_CG06-09_8_20_14_all_40_14]PIS13044.1 MAG: 30S ribosomal protein S21 [candidate division WWE3 bacterium CG09_land_8_20_14_0_10_39_24]PJE51896.1 MAG: 30S ribosomal protein S21 [candidate division WWE3 bacterium CG10_big_fil_rev_8_21_14_0_10_39_14]
MVLFAKKTMVKVKVQPGESIEQALRRFNREVIEEGIIDEVKEREFYIKPSQIKRERNKIRQTRLNRDKRNNG